MPPRDVMARAADSAGSSPSPRLRGEGWGEGKQKALSGPVSAPLPNPLPTEVGRGNRSASPAPDALHSDGPIWREGAFHADDWRGVADDGQLPDGSVVVSKARWLAEREALAARHAPLGLRLEPGEDIDDLAADLPRFALIVLSFPKFSDGRPFSAARLLREKHDFQGELRAVGDVLADQIPFMRRVGFDSYEVVNAPTRRALAEGRVADVTLHYQPTGLAEPGAGTRPWLRRTPA